MGITNTGNRIPSGTSKAGIVSGATNTNAGTLSFIGGSARNVLQSNATGSLIGGGQRNLIEANITNAVIVGGSLNRIDEKSYASSDAFIGGGLSNRVSGLRAVVSGGSGNKAVNWLTTVSGGSMNTASCHNATVSGGGANTASGLLAFIGGGSGNVASSNGATISGGINNTASGVNSTISGGGGNMASVMGSTVPGRMRGQATNVGSFVWSGDTNPNVTTSSWGDFTFTVRARGGARIYTSTSNTGVFLPSSQTAWSSLSDRTAKTDFERIDKWEILQKVAKLPVTSWHYKHDLERRYNGPNAQDFHATFGLGSDDKTISTLDSDGVMYAAIQGLVEELKDLDRAMTKRDLELESLKSELKDLKMRLDSMAPPKTP